MIPDQIAASILERLTRVETLVTERGQTGETRFTGLTERMNRMDGKLDKLLQGNHRNNLTTGGGWAVGGAGFTTAVVTVLKAVGVL